MQIYKLSKETLCKLASRSLQGILLEQEYSLAEGAELEILFEQTSISWKREHNGPDELIMSEHTPMCIAESILELITCYKIKLKIGQYETD